MCWSRWVSEVEPVAGLSTAELGALLRAAGDFTGKMNDIKCLGVL